MSAKHTPGPWNMFSEKDGAREINPENWLGLPNKSRSGLIARVSPWDGDERFVDEATANARLIVAAPDLLKAAKEARAALQEFITEEPASEWMAVALLDAAIAKAEGRQ